MTNKEVIEGNKIIAKFIGARPTQIDHTYETISDEFLELFKVCSVPFDEIRFDLFWDHIIPVIKKIEALNYEDGIEVCVYRNECAISTMGYTQSTITEQKGDTKIEAVWLAIIDFIKWYNKLDK